MPHQAALEALQEFVIAAGVPLSRDALSVFRDVFAQTVGAFMQHHDALSEDEIWGNDAFRDFILGRTRRTASKCVAALRARGEASVIDATTLLGESVGVMRDAKAACEARVEHGRVVGVPGNPGAHEQDGRICERFLASKIE